MFEYIEGKIVELTPTYLVLDNNQIGYFINVSLNTYSEISEKQISKIFIHQVIKEDSNTLFGFSSPDEREIFRHLITVSGIGANTARMMLSSLNPSELQTAISTENVNALKSIKGIGAKTAQRVIIDLKDKITKTQVSDQIFAQSVNNSREEALSALVMLGFNKKPAEKVIDKLIKQNGESSVEELIKKSLNEL